MCFLHIDFSIKVKSEFEFISIILLSQAVPLGGNNAMDSKDQCCVIQLLELKLLSAGKKDFYI